MKKIITSFILLLAISSQSIVSAAETASIKLNSLGYLPQAIKKATVTTEATVFQVINSQTGLEVFQGKLSEPVYQKDVDQKV